MAREFTIEALIEWAAREEWPKVPAPAGNMASAESALAQMADLGIRVSVNAYGVVPDMVWAGGPHAAAALLHRIITSLGDLDIDGEGVDLMTDWPAEGEEAAMLAEAAQRGLRQMTASGGITGRRLGDLLLRCAISGPPKGWAAPRPAFDVLRGDDGRAKWFRMVDQPVAFDAKGKPTAFERCELDGWDKSNWRPYAGAYHKHTLSPDPAPVARARAEWQLWRAALDLVHAVIDAGQIGFSAGAGREWVSWPQDIRVLPSALPFAPWLDGWQPADRRILIAV